MSNTKRQQNAYKGETRSKAILSEYFWVLSRSVDIDGVDIIVQEIIDTQEEIVEARKFHQTFAYVQAKFFEGRNQVRISRDYVEDGEEPRVGFFAFLHSGADTQKTHYFFSAEEIINEWYLSKCENYYCFSLTEKRIYSNYKNREDSVIAELIRRDLHRTKISLNFSLISRFFGLYADVKKGNQITYLLRIVENCPVVLCREDGGYTRPLEPRRDLFNSSRDGWYSGNFRWGYKGTSVQFLSASILGHYFGGRVPTFQERRMFLQNLISQLDENEEYDISEDAILIALQGTEYMLTPRKFLID